jgi:hypothetical protein
MWHRYTIQLLLWLLHSTWERPPTTPTLLPLLSLLLLLRPTHEALQNSRTQEIHFLKLIYFLSIAIAVNHT